MGAKDAKISYYLKKLFATLASSAVRIQDLILETALAFAEITNFVAELPFNLLSRENSVKLLLPASR